MLTLASLLMVAAALAQAQPQEAKPESGAQDAAGEKTTADDRSPSLDELLGIEEDESVRAADEIAAQESEAELQRRLNAEELGSAFEQAIAKMAISAELLNERFDTGLGTQRAQEEVLAKLEQLVDIARSMQSNSSSSSSSSTQQQQPSQQQPGKNQAQADQASSQNRRTNASDSQEGDPPARRDGDINATFDESRTEWGSLPQRVRDMLLQGRREKFSSLYEQLTREYYQRLAEEGSS
jgi:hypothetical protein